MTIIENLYFYAYLFGMTTKQIESRVKKLIEIFSLAFDHRRVSDLRYRFQTNLVNHKDLSYFHIFVHL